MPDHRAGRAHELALWWSECPGAGEVLGYSGEDIWRCSCGWRDDDDYSLAPGPSDRAVRHAAMTGGTVAFPDPSTGWRDYPAIDRNGRHSRTLADGARPVTWGPMDADQLFLATLDDLRSRSQPGRSEYDVLAISALLRKLLLDAGRLTDEVNRPHRLRLRFVANRGTPPTDPKPVFWSVQDGLDPNTGRPGRTPDEMSRDQFLAVTIIQVNGVDLTVRDVVDYLANVGGGVHHGKPTTAKEFALASVESAVRIGGYPPALRSLLAAARVTLHALEPLRSAILAGTPPA